MKAKLIKEDGYFYLISDKEIKSGDEYIKLDNRPRTLLIGTTVSSAKVPKLSLKNCQAIEKGYDLDELAKEKYPYEKTEMFSCFELDCKQEGFIEGSKTILEILGDKKFSEEDMMRAYNKGSNNGALHEAMCDDYDNIEAIKEAGEYSEECEADFRKSLQQTEWDVDIVMEDVFVHSPSLSPNQKSRWEKKPLLDADGNLILKRK